MIISLFIRHFKIYKGINYIPISEGDGFSSLIGENGVGKSSVLEALDYAMNKRNNQDWPVNNEAKYEGGLGAVNVPFIAPVFLIKKGDLRSAKKEDREQYEKALKLSKFLWETKKAKSNAQDDFFKHRDTLKQLYDPQDHLLIMIGRKYNENGIYFSGFHSNLDFITSAPHIEESELQIYFKGFYEYIVSHYSYVYIPVETDVITYTRLETQDMQKLMDRSIHSEIEKSIKPDTLKRINSDLDAFITDVENVLGAYKYKGRYKNQLMMPDLVSKIIEAYFSVKVLNKKTDSGSKLIPVSELSTGEKRKALVDVACSFLLNNKNRSSYIILAIDEPEASLHISNCYEQFEKLVRISQLGNQVIISTHWYGYLPIVSNGSAISITRNKNELTFDYLDLYNYRETITQNRKNNKGDLPIHYNIKSYNDLVQSIVYSLIQDNPYNWIICEGSSEKIYFEEFFKKEIENKNLRLLPLGGYKEVRKIYSHLLTPIKDPDYKIKGKVFCIIDTDDEKINVSCEKNKYLYFDRLINKDKKETVLIDVDDNLANPPTTIEDCLHPVLFYQTLFEFSEEDSGLKEILTHNNLLETAKCSGYALDLRDSQKSVIKNFFNTNEGDNKIRFAKKYVELSRTRFFKDIEELEWIRGLKNRINR